MSILIEKRNELAKLLEAIKAKQAEIDGFEYESSESDYDDFIDEMYGSIDIAAGTFSASKILKECDPTAYRCGKADFDSNFDVCEVEEYTDLEKELEDLKEQRDGLVSEIEDLEAEEEESEE